MHNNRRRQLVNSTGTSALRERARNQAFLAFSGRHRQD